MFCNTQPATKEEFLTALNEKKTNKMEAPFVDNFITGTQTSKYNKITDDAEPDSQDDPIGDDERGLAQYALQLRERFF